ncbi:hypothetical protein EJ110_NYTH46905 [Nymphaea thermarum]|nr:hypothetical protein EJ110_NYTH46905 [Nymphaea thermarum]
MLMLENQIPLLVLKRFLDAGKEGEVGNSVDLNRLIAKFFDCPSFSMPDLGLHVLDVYRKCIIRSPKQSSNHHAPFPFPKGIDLIGVKFRRSKQQSGLNIKFSRYGVLTLPFIKIDSHTAPVYMNLMAFERMHPEAGCQVTSYVAFMDDLIDTAEDVSLLSSNAIVRNDLGSNDAAANLFNRLECMACTSEAYLLQQSMVPVITLCCRISASFNNCTDSVFHPVLLHPPLNNIEVNNVLGPKCGSITDCSKSF